MAHIFVQRKFEITNLFQFKLKACMNFVLFYLNQLITPTTFTTIGLLLLIIFCETIQKRVIHQRVADVDCQSSTCLCTEKKKKSSACSSGTGLIGLRIF